MEQEDKKKRGCVFWALVVAGAVLAFFVVITAAALMMTTPEERERYAAEAEAERVERERIEAERIANEEAEEAARASTALREYRQAVTQLIVPCDAAQLTVADALQDFANADRYQLAEDAQAMRMACGNAWLGIDDIDLPDPIDSEREGQIETMVDECKLALYSRKELAEALTPLIDGDLRPSTMVAAREEMRFAGAQNQACAAALQPLMEEDAS